MKFILKKKYFKIVILGHILCSLIGSFSFFGSILSNVGSENRAYAYLGIGTTLADDVLSRILCMIISSMLAILFIYLFWLLCFTLFCSIKEKNWNAYLFLVVISLGIILILLFYPNMFGLETTDDYMNYVYAKEFLPMYWHGFFTNVVYCACMLVVPHPVMIPIVQFIFANCVVFNLFTNVKVSKKYTLAVACIVGCGSLLLLPEFIRVFLCPTRNCMYVILVSGTFSILFVDYIKENQITEKKFYVLACLFALTGCWRGEGSIYLISFPFFYWIVYSREQKMVTLSNIKKILFYILICVIFMIPDKYGVAKYQNSDYMIANTTGPLSAIFHDENANYSYKECQKDLSNIGAVIPIEYIEKYGCNGGFYYNVVQGNFVRQSCVSKDVGNAYVKSSFRFMLYNLPIWIKYQANMFLDANCIQGFRFSIDYGKETLENWNSYEAYERAFELYDAGEADLQQLELLYDKSTFADVLESKISYILSQVYTCVRPNTAWFKIILIIFTVVSGIISLIKKEYFFVLIAVANLGIWAVVLLMAPWSRPNYYYSVFINMYLAAVFYFIGKFSVKY